MLDRLPPELLAEVVRLLATVRTLASLSLTCRALHVYVEAEGWKIYARTRHPFVPLPADFSDWRHAVHGMTRLARNLQRRAFLATWPEPSGHIVHLPKRIVKTSWQKPKGQTMGTQPIIDSYSLVNGSSWRSQAEVVAWSAGAELLVRRQERSSRARTAWFRASPEQRQTLFDEHRNPRQWFSYRESRHREGYDDITSVNLVRPDQLQSAPQGAETCFVGRASGHLSLLELSEERGEVVKTFDTRGSPVRSASLMTGPDPLLAVSLGDQRIALFDSRSDTAATTSPLSEVNCCMPDDGPATRAWCTAFLSDHRLVVGRGPSREIVSVYGLHEAGLTETPLRTLRTPSRPSTSVYSVAALPTAASSGSSSPDLFFTGAYDGVIRLHDLRAPDDVALSMIDPIDPNPVFSLLAIGRERVVAGSSGQGVIKFFDLRTPSRRGLLCSDLEGRPAGDSPYEPDPHDGWNLFGQGADRVASAASSPVYSLSRPSPWSTNIYAGMVDSVLQLNFTASNDKYPDPVFKNQVRLSKSKNINSAKTWDPTGSSVKALSMVEHTRSARFLILRQMPLLSPDWSIEHAPGPAYDSRWTNLAPKLPPAGTGRGRENQNFAGRRQRPAVR